MSMTKLSQVKCKEYIKDAKLSMHAIEYSYMHGDTVAKRYIDMNGSSTVQFMHHLYRQERM